MTHTEQESWRKAFEMKKSRTTPPITLPRLCGALAPLALFFATSVVGANALQLVCRQYSAIDATELLETIKVSATESGSVRVWHRRERSRYLREEEGDRKVLGHWMSTLPGSGGKFSVIAIEEAFDGLVFPPSVYFIDWGSAKFAKASVPFTLDPAAQIDTRWECNRLD